MTLLKKPISALIAACFLVNTAVVDVSYALAPSSGFDDLRGPEAKEMATIKMALTLDFTPLVATWKSVGTNPDELKKILEKTSQYKNTIFTPPGMAFFFDDMSQVGERVLVKCRVSRPLGGTVTYYAAIEPRSAPDGKSVYPDMEVYTEAEYTGMAGIIAHDENFPRRSGRKPQDAESIRRYIEEGEAIDDVIARKYRDGEVLEFKKRSEKMRRIYPGMKKLPDGNYLPDGNLWKLIKNADEFLRNFGTGFGKIFDERNIVLVRVGNGPSTYRMPPYPMIEVGGQKVMAYSHLSRQSLYLFLPDEVFDHLKRGDYSYPETVIYNQLIDRVLHEAGAAHNLRHRLAHGQIKNAFDFIRERCGRRIPAKFVEEIKRQYLTQDELARLAAGPADLDKNLRGRDYAAGAQSERESTDISMPAAVADRMKQGVAAERPLPDKELKPVALLESAMRSVLRETFGLEVGSHAKEPWFFVSRLKRLNNAFLGLDSRRKDIYLAKEARLSFNDMYRLRDGTYAIPSWYDSKPYFLLIDFGPEKMGVEVLTEDELDRMKGQESFLYPARDPGDKAIIDSYIAHEENIDRLIRTRIKERAYMVIEERVAETRNDRGRVEALYEKIKDATYRDLMRIFTIITHGGANYKKLRGILPKKIIFINSGDRLPRQTVYSLDGGWCGIRARSHRGPQGCYVFLTETEYHALKIYGDGLYAPYTKGVSSSEEVKCDPEYLLPEIIRTIVHECGDGLGLQVIKIDGGKPVNELDRAYREFLGSQYIRNIDAYSVLAKIAKSEEPFVDDSLRGVNAAGRKYVRDLAAGEALRHEHPVAETAADLSDLAPHPMVNALLKIILTCAKMGKWREELKKFVEYDPVTNIYWFGRKARVWRGLFRTEARDNNNFRDIFNELVRIYALQHGRKMVSIDDEKAVFDQMVKACGGQDYGYTYSSIQKCLAFQVEHFGVEKGTTYAMSRYRDAFTARTLYTHVKLERQVHQNIIRSNFGMDTAAYRRWRQSPAETHKINDTVEIDGRTVKIQDASRDMTYNQFAILAHKFAETLAPVATGHVKKHAGREGGYADYPVAETAEAVISGSPDAVKPDLVAAIMGDSGNDERRPDKARRNDGGILSAAAIGLKAAAGEIGKELTPPVVKYNLIIDSRFFAPGELDAYKRIYGERFNLQTFKVQKANGRPLSVDDMVNDISGQAKGDKDKTIVLISNGWPIDRMERLTKAGVRILIADINSIVTGRSDKYDLDKALARQTFQRDTFAMLLLMRGLKGDESDERARMVLGLYLDTYFEFRNGVTVDDYILAITTKDIERLIKGYLVYRPVTAVNAEKEHDEITHALIFA